MKENHTNIDNFISITYQRSCGKIDSESIRAEITYISVVKFLKFISDVDLRSSLKEFRHIYVEVSISIWNFLTRFLFTKM